MIGLLQLPAIHERDRVLSARCLRACLFGTLVLLFTSDPLWGQGQRGQRQGGLQQQLLDQFRGQLGGSAKPEEEEPVKKPNLAERNNITPQPLMTLKEEAAYKNLIRQKEYTAALRTQNPRGAEEKLIEGGVKARVYRLTLPENWNNLANLRRDLVNDIDNFAGDEHPRTRAMALNAAIKYLTELLTDQPYVVKLNAALLLGQLNEKSASPLDNVTAKPYAAAAEPLVQVIQSSDQPPAVKVAATIGLQRMFRDGSPPRSLRDQTAKLFVEELRDMQSRELTDGQVWYYWRIVETLGVFDEPRNALQQPLVVDALWETMLNETLPWHIRTNAARSLSQLDFDSSFNVGLVAHEIVKLCGKMTVQFNKAPHLPYWRRCFLDLYFAFNPHHEDEVQRGWGLRQQADGASLRAHKNLVDGAYAQVLNMVNAAVKNEPPRPVADELLRDAFKWMQANPPTDQKLHADAKTVDAIQKSFAAPQKETTAVSQQPAPQETN